MFSATSTRVPEHTAENVNQRIHRSMEIRVAYYANAPTQVDPRLHELDREWDIDRMFELWASAMALTGLILAIWSLWWLVIPVVVVVFVLMHAVAGWSPPVSLLRRLGVRTASEIDEERYALKALRGDFVKVSQEPAGTPSRGGDAIAAAETMYTY